MSTGHRSTTTFAGRSVLIVEDEFYLAMELQEEVERAGGRVVGPAGDLADGLEAVERGGFDLALVDINLGAGPSYAIPDALAAAGKPFVFLTGYDVTAIPDRFASISRVQKPATTATIVRAIEQVEAG